MFLSRYLYFRPSLLQINDPTPHNNDPKSYGTSKCCGITQYNTKTKMFSNLLQNNIHFVCIILITCFFNSIGVLV